MTTCGIDFGTSNSALALFDANGVRLLPVEGAAVTIPTVMFYEQGQREPIFGRAAISHYLNGHHGRFMRALKSILGSSLMDERTVINGKATPFLEVITGFLTNLRSVYERETGELPQQVVLGRPVWFVDGNPRADQAAQDQLEKAAQAAGFRHIAFQYEPIAAALDYEQRVTGEELVMVADIGAGTSDFSLVRVGAQRAKAADRKNDILANGGVHLGGNDFDRALSLDAVMPSFGYKTKTKQAGRVQPNSYFLDLATWHKIHFLYTAKTRRDVEAMSKDSLVPERLERFLDVLEHFSGHDVAYQVEAAKIALSGAAQAKIDLAMLEDPLTLSATRPQFEEAAAASLGSITSSLGDTLAAAGVKSSDVTTLVMTGGAAQMPLLRSALRDQLPAATLYEADAFASVASGLAVDAAKRFGG